MQPRESKYLISEIAGELGDEWRSDESCAHQQVTWGIFLVFLVIVKDRFPAIRIINFATGGRIEKRLRCM